MNLRDLASKFKGYVQSKTQDDEGWIRRGNFAPKQQVQQMGQNLQDWRTVAKQGINNQLAKDQKLFNETVWQPIKNNPALAPIAQRYESAIPAIERQLNPFKVQDRKQNWEDSKKVGAAALTTAGLLASPAVKLSSMIGGAVINPIIKAGVNLYEKKPIGEGVVNAIPEGAGMGLANAGTTRLTNSIVQSLANKIPVFKSLTEESLKKGLPVATDTVRQAVSKFFDTAGKRLVKAAVLETAVETPIWATLTQSEQETYVEALQREAIENLVLNVGMAGVQSLGDSKSLAPIVKKSINTAVDNYMKSASTPEAIKKQGGYLDMFSNVRDGTARTSDYDNAVMVIKARDTTPQEKMEAIQTIEQLGRKMFSASQYKQLTTGRNVDIENLTRAVGDKIKADVSMNVGYKEPINIPNILEMTRSERGGIDLTDTSKPFPQKPSIPEVGGKGVKPILGQTENGTLFRGYGADRPKMIGSDLGSGRYFSESIDTAKSYGPKVESINTSGLKLKEMDIVDYKKLVSQRYHEVRNNHPLWDGSDTAATKIMDEAKDFVNQQLASQGYQGLKTKIGKETIYNIFSEDIAQLPKQAQEIGLKTTESSKLPLKTTQPIISSPSIPEVGGKNIVWRSESGMDKNGVSLAGGNATSFSTTKELASQYGEAKPFQLTRKPKLANISELQPENMGGIVPYKTWQKIEQTGGARGTEMEKFLKSKGFDGYKSGDEMVLLNREIVKPQSPSIPEVKQTIKIKPNDDLQTQFEKKIKVTESKPLNITEPELKQRGFSASVQQSPQVSNKTKIKVTGTYETKPNEQLMGEAKALLTEGGSIRNLDKIENLDTKIAATIQKALNLDAQGKHKEAADLYNNLSVLGTKLGRSVQSFNLLNKMSPEAITLSIRGKISEYNSTHSRKLPEITKEQEKILKDEINKALSLPEGEAKNIAMGRVAQKINSFIPASFVDKAITVWKAGLLTSLRTHERNLLGNTIMQGGEVAKDIPASIADYLMSLKTGQRTVSPTLKGTGAGAVEGTRIAGQTLKHGVDPTAQGNKFETRKINWGDSKLGKVFKKYTDTVFDTLSVEDKPFWQSAYQRSLNQQIKVNKINTGKVTEPTDVMKAIAIADADYSTFHDKTRVSDLASGFKKTMSKTEYGKFISEVLMPFTGVPSSIVMKTFDYSPLGLIKGIKDFSNVIIKDMPELQRQASQEIGRGVIGSGLFALGAYLVQKGLMTGQPRDTKEAQQWQLEGKQANSVLINGKWRNINSIGPQNLVMLAGGKWQEDMGGDEKNLGKFAFGIGKDQLEQTFLQGVQQPLQAINDPDRFGKSYAGGQIASWIPNIVKDTSKSLDPMMREKNTTLDYLKEAIPGVRNNMIPNRDVLGNPRPQEPTGIGAYVDLFNSKTPISNTVVDELSRLNKAGFISSPSKIQKDQTIGGVKMKLEPKELDLYEQAAGKELVSTLDNLFKSNSYQKLDDESKQKAIGDVTTKVRKQVRANLDIGTPDMGYVKSADAPSGVGEKITVYGKSVLTDPKQTIKAVLSGNPIRKVENGTVVLERQNKLGSLDKGDTSTQVDHTIPLALGGTNNKDNLKILTNEEHTIKTKYDNYLIKQVKEGKLTKNEAQKLAKDWRNQVDNIPSSVQKDIVNTLKGNVIGKEYTLISEAGTVTTIDLSKEIKAPELTGFAEIDKKLKSNYKSALTKRKNDIIKLYEDGQITAEEANKLLTKVSAKSGTGTKSKKKVTFKVTEHKIPKFNIKISSPTASKFKLKSAPKIKISKTDNRKYTIKA